MIYPGRVGRTMMIDDFMEKPVVVSAVLCGRVTGLIDVDERGFVLQDESGRLEVMTDKLPRAGDIVQVGVERGGDGRVRLAGEVKVLASCDDFYISPTGSPNYQKIILDDRLKDNLIKRAEVIAAIREFFADGKFVETDTPCLVMLPGMEPYLDVFKTRFEADFAADNKIREDMYLITSPEYAMKKLLVGGMERVFQITRSFRNKETFSERHNPEFTILEWYRAYASYEEIMSDTEALLKFLWQKFRPESDGVLDWKGQKVNIMAPWRRLRVIDAFREMAGIDEQTFFDLPKFREVVRERGYTTSSDAGFDDLFYLIFLNEIEPGLGMDVPVILCDYPVSMAALSKKCAEDGRFAERFEVYVAGLELCNGFTELNDPVEQESRLTLEREERRGLGKDIYGVDKTFIDALKLGMPPSGGNALGVDRVIMLLLGVEDIRNIIWFPHRDL